jgi:hypothetical protein
MGRTNRLLSSIRHGPHSKRRVQKLLYSCVCICYRCNIPNEPLPSNDRGIFTEPLPSNYKGETQTQTDSNVTSYAYSIFKKMEVGQKCS